MATREELESKTRPELVKLAAAQGVEESNKKTKVELVDALYLLNELDPEVENVVGDVSVLSEAELEEELDLAEEVRTPPTYPSPYGRRVAMKAVLYTDGTSGVADMNHERAYEYNERLQSNDPSKRMGGDVSLSEAAKAKMSEAEWKEAHTVKTGQRGW